MALELKLSFKIVDNSKIVITDETGFYNETNNPGGWGTPNLPRNFTGEAVAKFTKKGSASLTEIDVKTTILNAQLPYYELCVFEPESLTDGIYYLYLIVRDTTDPSDKVSYIAELIIPMYGNIACCVYKKAVAVAEDLCTQECESTELNEFDIISTYYEAICNVSTSLGEDAFLKILKQLQKFCGYTPESDCGCGCGGC